MTSSTKFTDRIKSKSQKAEKPNLSEATLETIASYEVSEDRRKTAEERMMDPVDYFLHLFAEEDKHQST